MIPPKQITGVVLAGGRGSRMGGVDKGLERFGDQPLAQHALERLRPQVGPCLVNANRHLETYRAFGAPVVTDTLPDFAGPLAGVLAALGACTTPWLATVPCDSPLFPADLVARLASAAAAQGAEIAMVVAPDSESGGALRRQPVFCLLRTGLRDSLRAFLDGGGRKIGAWTDCHATVGVAFNAPGDDPRAFANANTLPELASLQRS